MTFQVVVENEEGTVEHNFKVAVKMAPVIIDADRYREHQILPRGENARLQLAFSG